MAVEHEKFLLAQKVAKMAAQMKVFKQGSGASTPDPSSPTLEQFDHQKIKQELDNEYSFMPTPELSYGKPGSSFASPSTMTYSLSASPPNLGLGLDDDDSLTTSPDMTQHPAAMLCDLQCQSAGACQASPTQPTTAPTPTTVTPSSTAPLAYLMLISAVYSQLMLPLETIFTSLKTGSPLPLALPSSTNPTTTTTTTPSSAAMILLLVRWLISTPATLTPTPTNSTTASKPTSTTKATAISQATCSRTPVLRPRMLRRLLLSSPSLARPLSRAATGRTLRLKASMLSGLGDGAPRTGTLWVARSGREGKAGLSHKRSGVRQYRHGRNLPSAVRTSFKSRERRGKGGEWKSQ